MNRYQKQTIRTLPKAQAHPRFGPLSTTSKIFLLVILHIILALLFRNYQMLSTAHALVTFAISAFVALTSDNLNKLIPYLAYIMGAEVLWRMTKANVFWEFGKYATVAIILIALLRHRKIKQATLPTVFLLLHLPSILLTINAVGLTVRARDLISFNVSGALATAVCMVFFLQIKANISEFKSWAWAAAYPTIAILTLAVYSLATAEQIAFTTEASFQASGGFGPNQVSAALGLGGMLLILLTTLYDAQNQRLWALLIGIALLTQSVLTLSRGGVVNVIVALSLAFIHLLGSPTKFIKGVMVFFFIGVAAYLLILPRLNEFTSGMLEARYSELDVTGRDEIFMAEIDLWRENQIFGVGPGMSSYMRTYKPGAAAHTEYSRIVAEHGSLGLLAMLSLLLALFLAYRKAPDILSRALIVALASWSFVEMTHSAMRLVSISFMLGLAVIQWQVPGEGDNPLVKKEMVSTKKLT